MGFLESIKLALTSLRANKLRSLLTMLGIIIGISAVITITTIGNSIQQTLANTFNQVNMNYFYVSLSIKPYTGEDGMTYDEYYESAVITDDDLISEKMIDELYEKYPGKYHVIDVSAFGEGETINEKNQYIKTVFIGTTDGYCEENKFDIVMGREFTRRDDKEARNVTIVSDIFVRQFFGEGVDPLGKTITFSIDGQETYDFVVVGVYEYSEKKLGKFEPGTREIDKVTYAFIPNGFINKVNGITETKFRYCDISWAANCDSAECEAELREFFDEKYEHNKYWTVSLENMQSNVKMIDTAIMIVTIAISVIAAISLIVGGVGVMNIMLVSIIERTREIGIRKALGAQNGTIRLQFVVESIIICLIGGIIGILSGIMNGVIIGKIASYIVETSVDEDIVNILVISIQPSAKAIIISVIFSMLTGVFFGYYPANKAAKMNPIDALRYD